MPVKVKKGTGKKPYKIIEASTGKVVGSSRTRMAANAAARIRNRSYRKASSKS